MLFVYQITSLLSLCNANVLRWLVYDISSISILHMVNTYYSTAPDSDKCCKLIQVKWYCSGTASTIFQPFESVSNTKDIRHSVFTCNCNTLCCNQYHFFVSLFVSHIITSLSFIPMTQCNIYEYVVFHHIWLVYNIYESIANYLGSNIKPLRHSPYYSNLKTQGLFLGIHNLFSWSVCVCQRAVLRILNTLHLPPSTLYSLLCSTYFPPTTWYFCYSYHILTSSKRWLPIGHQFKMTVDQGSQ